MDAMADDFKSRLTRMRALRFTQSVSATFRRDLLARPSALPGDDSKSVSSVKSARGAPVGISRSNSSLSTFYVPSLHQRNASRPLAIRKLSGAVARQREPLAQLTAESDTSGCESGTARLMSLPITKGERFLLFLFTSRLPAFHALFRPKVDNETASPKSALDKKALCCQVFFCLLLFTTLFSA